MSFATPRDGYSSPRSGLPPLPLSLLEESKKAGRTLTPRGAPSPRISPITPRVPAPAPVPELRGAALLSAAEAGAVQPQLRLPAPLRPTARLHSSEGLRAPLAELSRNLASVPLMSSRSSSASGSWGGGSGASGDSSGAAAAPAGPLSRLWRALLPLKVTPDELRVPTQMFVSVCVAALLFVFSKPHAFLHGKGLWTVITVILVLESTFGATLKKVKLRMVGTLVGGGLGGAIVAAANVINGGWQPKDGELDAVPKSLTVAFLVAAAAWVLEFGRLRDPNREYAYSVSMITMSLASLSDFYEDSWISVRISVWWRCCTIVTGVAISGTVCMLVLPVFAGDVARAALAEALRAAAALLGGVVELYLTDEDGDGCVDGRSGLELLDEGVDAGLALKHAPLHALEDDISHALERLRPAVQQASEEVRCASSPLPCVPFARAAGRARLLYTGSVALLHFMESDFIRIRLCTRHAHAIRRARNAVTAASEDLATRVAAKQPAAGAAPALAAAEQAIAALLADVAADPQAGPGGADDCDMCDDEASAKEAAAAITAADMESLGHVCFALADALRQIKLIVSDIDPNGRAAMAALEAEAVAAQCAGKKAEAVYCAPKIGGRRCSTLM